MLDLRADSIIYQSQSYLLDLTDSITEKGHVGKKKQEDWERAGKIVAYLEAWEERSKIDDITQMNYILECLIDIAKLNEFPAAPTILVSSPPSILYGLPGAPGSTGAPGAQGPAGLATDFSTIMVAVSSVVDSFNVGDAYGARWDYYVQEAGGAQRVGTVIGTWDATGANREMNDYSTPDLISSTAGIEFDLQLSGGNIQLVAVITSGTWDIRGSRYFIPNNGNGSGPISDSLADGLMYIGNSSNIATARSITGVLGITNLGVTSFNTSAADAMLNLINSNGTVLIDLNNLALLTGDRVVVTDGPGNLTVSSVTATALATYQGQIDTKLTDPTTTIGDIIHRNGSNLIARLGVGSEGQVLTVTSGVPSWQTPGAVVLNLNEGSIYVGNASNLAAQLAIGAADSMLISDGTTLSWQAIDTGAWTTTSYENSWSTSGTVAVAYKKDRLGVVHLRGEAFRAAGDTTAAMTTLPVGARPAAEMVIIAAQNAALSYVRIKINAGGGIECIPAGNRIYLAGISFPTT